MTRKPKRVRNLLKLTRKRIRIHIRLPIILLRKCPPMYLRQNLPRWPTKRDLNRWLRSLKKIRKYRPRQRWIQDQSLNLENQPVKSLSRQITRSLRLTKWSPRRNSPPTMPLSAIPHRIWAISKRRNWKVRKATRTRPRRASTRLYRPRVDSALNTTKCMTSIKAQMTVSTIPQATHQLS